ncbi:MAG: hypothetical protein MUF84_09855 [Anaerolineae bacterium]|nr:hypothetical protein [Anaerolineae bacterium]
MDRRRLLRVGMVCLAAVVGLACSLVSANGGQDEVPSATLESGIRPKATSTVGVVPLAQPTATPEAPVDAGSCSLPQAAYGDVGFCYDPGVATSVEELVLPAADEEVTFGEFWSLPERLQFGLQGYPRGMDRQGQPHMIIYPTEALRAANPQAAEMIDAITRLLDTKPAPRTLDSIPVFLPVNAAQVYRARVRYVQEGNARGVAFLTAYAQDLTPVVNESLFYIYEGFIGDGRQLVVAWLPVYHPSLRDTWAEYTQEELAPLYDDYEAYLDEALANLEMQPADSFIPDLDLLEAMMLSVQVR